MSVPHIILELRTNRDSESKADAMVPFFASFPNLKNNFIWKLLGKDEKFALEIVVENQTIFFQAYVPERLNNYFKSILVASYPEIVIKEIEKDSLTDFNIYIDHVSNTQEHQTAFGSMNLQRAEYLPLKTFLDFSQTDAMAPLLSTLSKLKINNKAIVQFLISKDNENWKTKIPTSSENASQGVALQKQKISKKLDSTTLKVAIKIGVASSSSEEANLVLENIATTFDAVNDSEGNGLVLRKVYLFKNRFYKLLQERNFSGANNFHLSLEELSTLLHMPNKDLSLIPNIAWGKNLLGEPPEFLPIVTREMMAEEKKNINPFASTHYKNRDVIYGLRRNDRRRHMYVIGKTGTGKSTLLANMAINDLKNDEGICVIDPHGDLVETLLEYIPSRRINDVIYFNPSDLERTVQINLFEDESVAHRELIASGIVSVFKKLYGYSWGPRLEYILRNALLTLLKTEQARLSDVLELLTNTAFRKKIVDNLDDPILKSFWVDEYNKMQDRQRTDSIASILNKVGQFVSSPIVRNIVNAKKSSFSIEQAMNEGKIILVNLSQGRLGEDNATLLGSMLITKIQLAAMGRVDIPEEKRRDFYLYVDEFQNFATESFNKILSEARKYRLNLILANQYIAQIPEDVQKAIFGNCGSMASFVMGADDAAVFSKEYGDKYTVDDLVSLNKYQIINKLSIDNVISKPFPAITLGLAKSRNSNKEKVIKVSGERYAKKKD